MFAALQLERDPLKVEDLPALLISWTQDAGGFAFFFLCIWVVFYLIAQRSQTAASKVFLGGVVGLGTGIAGLTAYILLGPIGLIIFLLTRRGSATEVRVPGVGGAPRSALTTALFIAFAGWALIAYLVLGALYVPDVLRWAFSSSPFRRLGGPFRDRLEFLLMTVGGACAILAVVLPVLADLARLSPRRIGAIAKLSFKEAVRRRVVWAFALLVLIFLFAGWFIESKSEDQVRTYVKFVSLVMALLLLLVAGLVASFSIPTDIRNQTIHTILTKPVERFEVVLGRFLGFMMLMTLVLAATTVMSLLYVLRGIDPDAAEESLKARVPLFGELRFEGTPDPRKGESVGREWEYRGYIPGPNPPNPTAYAVWTFTALPSKLAQRDKVRCEYSFDIFRTTKGADDKEVTCSFIFETWRFRGDMSKFNERRKELRKSEPADVANDRAAEEFGYYEVLSVPVADYHTLFVDIPAGLFRNALADDPQRLQELKASGQPVVPLTVRVRCEDRTQYLGMAKYDFYFRADDHTSKADRLWFSWNFIKGSVGLWFWLCLVAGLATALSTYLSGVISFLVTAFLFVAGIFQEFIQNLAEGRNVGGGPTESMLRVIRGANMVTPLEDTAATRVATNVDVGFRWVFRRFLNALPDVDQFGLTGYVAEGFNISGGQLFINVVFLVGYLLPWAVLAYYMMRSREVASSS